VYFNKICHNFTKLNFYITHQIYLDKKSKWFYNTFMQYRWKIPLKLRENIKRAAALYQLTSTGLIKFLLSAFFSPEFDLEEMKRNFPQITLKKGYAVTVIQSSLPENLKILIDNYRTSISRESFINLVISSFFVEGRNPTQLRKSFGIGSLKSTKKERIFEVICSEEILEELSNYKGFSISRNPWKATQLITVKPEVFALFSEISEGFTLLREVTR